MTSPTQFNGVGSGVNQTKTAKKSDIQVSAKTPHVTNSPNSTSTNPAHQARLYLSQIEESIIEKLKPRIRQLVANFEEKKSAFLKNNSTSVSDNELRSYFFALADTLEPGEKEKLIEILTDYNQKKIEDQSGLELICGLNNNGAQFIDTKEEKQIWDIQEEFFKQKQNNEAEILKESLIDNAKFIYGSHNQWDRLPVPALGLGVGFHLVEAAKEAVNELKDSRFELLGNGSTGIGIKIDDGEFSAVLKLSIPPRDSYFGKAFEDEFYIIQSYEKMQQFSNIEIPQLVYDSNDKALAEPGLYIVKKLQTGEAIRNPESSDLYLELGYSGQLLKDYIKLIKEYAEAKIDIDDIRHYNYFYQALSGKLSIFEISLNGEPDQKTTERRDTFQKNPLATGLYSLMTDILTFQPKYRQAQKLIRDLESRAKEECEIDNLYERRTAQLIKTLNEMVKDNELSLNDLRSAIEFLQTDNDHMALTETGKGYLDQIAEEVQKPNFDKLSYPWFWVENFKIADK